jgi:hypothetical protein
MRRNALQVCAADGKKVPLCTLLLSLSDLEKYEKREGFA